MGASQSTGKRALNADVVVKRDNDDDGEKDDKVTTIGFVVLPFITTAHGVCQVARVCKSLHAAVNNNDAVWQALCHSYSPSSPPPPPNPKPYRRNQPYRTPPLHFVPPSKLVCHSWKQVYLQMLKYNSEMEEEKERYAERLQRWDKKYGGYACGMRCPSPPPARLVIPVDQIPGGPVAGFPEPPGKTVQKVLPFSVDLVQLAAQYLDLLIHASNLKWYFHNELFLQKALYRYVNFMHLKHKYKNYTLVPTLEIEYVWVSHMLRPSKYIHDCNAWFGEVIDHNILVENAYTYLNKARALQETNDLYVKEFGQPYCSKVLIEKQKNLPHFNTTGTGPLDPAHKDEESEAIGRPFSPPKHNVFIKRAPAYVGDVGEVEGTKGDDKRRQVIGISVSDLLMDEMWLTKFAEYMKDSVADPLNTKEIFSCATTYNQPAHMRPNEVYQNLWKAYEKFLYMAAKYPPSKGHYVHPSYAIDVIWHAHMICPKTYAKETKEWVGYLVDHEPWPDCDTKDMEESSNTTDVLWQKEFGLSLNKEHTTKIKMQNDTMTTSKSDHDDDLYS